jgi:uncharacterized protein (TIGR02147 family)
MVNANPTSSFRLFLQTELARRCAGNAQYSLRSFAHQLNVDHSTLSQLLRGKRSITRRMVEKIGNRLGLKAAEIEAFATHEQLMKLGNASVSNEVRQLTMDAVCLLSGTHDRAILELVQLDIFKADTRWIARVMNLDADEVNVIVSRLLRLGLLEMTDHHRWVDKSGLTSSDRDEFSRRVIQKLAEQVARLSGPTPETTESGCNESMKITMLVSGESIPFISTVIQKLKSDLDTQAESGKNNNAEIFEFEVRLNPAKGPAH